MSTRLTSLNNISILTSATSFDDISIWISLTNLDQITAFRNPGGMAKIMSDYEWIKEQNLSSSV